ncbi:MAG: fumarylacetoacetate hydrolase family protein [Flavobacteriales bacterium]|jgi:2-keto-4-pentenoate hydratase/2-oxohepta-3-ene-1,7-dioic acid hydratase in catechol pathway|nr:fumarylacetoacetate hydrolase family protein [Flavobacteriales bacterium]
MKIICIGRNYAKHAKELGNAIPKEPVFFMKPDSARLPKKAPFYYPNFTKDLHYEVELVIKINKLGKNISQKFAHTYYDEIGLGIDFTARDLQLECKEKGLPWEKAKAFDYSAPMSQKFIPKAEFKDLNSIAFSLHKNQEAVQLGNTKDMLFNFDELIVYLSQFMTLKIGDLIFTGTPAGVGPVSIGDHLEGFIEEQKMIDLKIK